MEEAGAAARAVALEEEARVAGVAAVVGVGVGVVGVVVGGLVGVVVVVDENLS